MMAVTGPTSEDDGGDGSDKSPFWRRRWVLITGGILIVLIVIGALTDTSGDDESDTATGDELAAAEDEPDESPATPTETTATTSESRAATTTEAPLVGESSLDSPIQLGAVVQAGSWRLRVSAITPDGTDEVMEENEFNDPPPEGNQFFIASLEATYTGTESSTFWVDMTLKSVGDSNVAYEGFDAWGPVPFLLRPLLCLHTGTGLVACTAQCLKVVELVSTSPVSGYQVIYFGGWVSTSDTGS